MDTKKITDIINLINIQPNPQMKKTINYFDFIFILECYFLEFFLTTVISNNIYKKLYIKKYTTNDYLKDSKKYKFLNSLNELEVETIIDIYNNYEFYKDKYYKYKNLTISNIIDKLVTMEVREDIKKVLIRENYIDKISKQT